MKRTTFILTFTLWTSITFGQTQQYYDLVKMADSLYEAKDYKNSGLTYSIAFKSNDRKATLWDRYNAACSWARAGYPDSAFFNLYHIATMMKFKNYGQVITDTDLKTLHDDLRWKPLLDIIKQNKDKAEANLIKPLVIQLDSIYLDDQTYRRQLIEIEKKLGWGSKESEQIWDIIRVKDSLNEMAVKGILDQYGWLGVDSIGEQGNKTLFLVIQHSNPVTQIKYLPMMRDAVKRGKANGSSLALLEDRVALGQGKMQIYGSQLWQDSSGTYVQPIEDVENVDKRRALIGLQPMAEYLKFWNLSWSIEKYKKELPIIEEKVKERQK
ncbi:MAG: hypothetical protein Q8M15_08580 [Bacteroidota bacterium]|nr:hypothetical protein [Bacteroidota bacterium]